MAPRSGAGLGCGIAGGVKDADNIEHAVNEEVE
jgi:hypothetical protein